MTGKERLQISAGMSRPTHMEIVLQHQPQPAETSVLANQESQFGQFEPYVDEDVVSRFVSFTPRRVLEMARNGEIPAHPLGRGARKTWRFLISEIDAHFRQKKQPVHATMTPAVPRASKRRIA